MLKQNRLKQNIACFCLNGEGSGEWMGARGEGFLSCKNVTHIKVLHAAILKFTFKVTYLQISIFFFYEL